MFRMLSNRRVLFAMAALGGLLAMALWPETLEVDVATVSRGALVVTVDEEGQTRVRDRFVVSALGGRRPRIGFAAGDPVRRGDAVARIQPVTAPLLDARTRAEGQAAVESAEAALERARAEEQQARAAVAQAERELARSRRLVDAGAVPAQDADARQDDARLGKEAAKAAASAVEAAVRSSSGHGPGWPPRPPRRAADVMVTAPADGVVLEAPSRKREHCPRPVRRSSSSVTPASWKSSSICCRPMRYGWMSALERRSSSGGSRRRSTRRSAGSSRPDSRDVSPRGRGATSERGAEVG